MKKLAISMAIAAAMGATAANAAVVSEYSVGLLVPNVIHDGNGNTTAVSLIARKAGVIYWTFFDENSKHVTDGAIEVTENDQVSFVWQNESGVGLENKRGYLIFLEDVDPDGTGPLKPDGVIDTTDSAAAPLAGSAVQVIPPDDAAYVPAFPLASVDLEDFPVSPTTLGAGSVDYLVAGANCVGSGNIITGTIGQLTESITGPYVDDIDMRYFIDGEVNSGNDTRIVVWSAQMIKGTYTVNMFDDEQNRKSVNFELKNEELNFIDPETIAGRPAGFTDGFIRWDVPCGYTDADHLNPAPWNGVITYSQVDAPDFKAVQTIINPFGTNVTP